MQLLIASTNLGKIAEVKLFLQSLPLNIIGLQDIQPAPKEVIEDGASFKDNAVLKARGYGKQANLLTLADDSGLEVDVLNGRPGVYSKRYGHTDTQRNQKLLQEMKEIESGQRQAHFTAAMALYDPNNDRVYTTSGITEGYILKQAEGNQGFGYDPIFFSTELQKCFAQASSEEKNTVSHRGKALQSLIPVLLQLIPNSSKE